MNEIKSSETNKLEEINLKSNENKNSPFKKFFRKVKDVVALLFWAFILIKLFVFDIDVYLVNKVSSKYVFLLDYKFVFFVGVLALIWIFTRSAKVLIVGLYVVFYPLIVVFWKVPVFIFKQKSWVLAFALLNFVISFFMSLKYNFIKVALYIVFATLIFSFSNPFLLWASIIVISSILILTFVHKFILLIRPSEVFKAYKSMLNRVETNENKFSSMSLDESIKNIPIEQLTETQLEKRRTSLHNSIITNRLFLFTANKLRDYQKSRLNFVSYILSVVSITIMTVLSFSLINFAMFKIDSSMFNYDKYPSFYTFFYYTFNDLLSNPIAELEPALPMTQIVAMLGTFFTFLIGAIFVGLIFSVRSQRYDEELTDIVKRINNHGGELETFIKEEYKIKSLEDALLEVEKMKGSLVKLIYKFTESINK
ncbi:hypothetical protein QJ133_02260 [Priestia megaterium]|uniref:hypothetical protein n=1 Tax=Priestia megaterium TaxID=1404 RepID=UPI00249A9EB6|nr:hypothetical protein [Priestia megaterium]MDI3090000.1 hypothetical protein [Priestia megaterium]